MTLHLPSVPAWPRRCLLRAAARALVALTAALGATGGALAGAIGDKVFEIEAQFGSQPGQVIERLRPLEAGARAGDTDDLRIFLAAWGYAHASIDKPSVAEAAVEELTDLGERLHDPAALASAYTLKAAMLSFSGQVRAAFGWVESALPLADKVPSPDLQYWVDMMAADMATSNGHLDEGVRMYEAAVVAARRGRNPRREAQAYLGLVPLHIVKGQLGVALRQAALVRELGARTTDPSLRISSWVLEALAADAQGDTRRSERARREAQNATLAALVEAPAGPQVPVNSQAGGDGWMGTEVDALLTLSALHQSAGNFGAARDLALRARTQAQAQNDDAHLAVALVNIGLADIRMGHIQQGMALANDGLARMGSRKRDAELLIQLNRYVAALERSGETSESWLRLRDALMLETELARRDRRSTVIELQRESSFQQRQRELDQLEHQNALQAAEIGRRAMERTLSLLLAAAMGLGGVVAWRLYLRARKANRQLALNNEALEFASHHDAVTGLLNRRAMEAHTTALHGQPYCNVSISVKQFGLIVGSVGHQQGDQLLCQIAGRLDAVARRHDATLYRVDGVTFGAIFRCAEGDTQRVRTVLQALAEAMEVPFEVGNQDLIVSIGAGAAHCPTDAPTAHEVARLAELAKLRTHAEPGNTHVLYDARIGESQHDKLHMEARMAKALEQGGFELYYQGQRSMADGRFCGFEALLRWHDGGKMVSPAQFIPLAEESGLIVRIGAWVLQQGCQQAKAWADAGFGAVKVAVNISPRQFNHPDFLATVRRTLQATGVDPAQIELEITEGSVMDAAEASIAQLHALRELGLQLSIDDFGTGYASLSYLRRFPLTRLKIDRSFVSQLGASAQDDTIVRTVIGLAHGLGLAVTAEGVETPAQEAMLQSWHCDVVQGFLHSRPAPAATATQLLVAEREALLQAAEA
ncbi:putative bifunctional diguanylate cyclase/phosphodiesterase [Ideonella sp. BN130291]|uniref:putative bifunctional diguanylate cyclase/phosphodiesterase n=1 Tax=Ideonella sp. BN130291 TaxID=3112940 RepID=UPI002E25BE55|nr:bifunctional diguanylate cyclase/phosphodiesterase [Ideonella sp. BN130291]